ESTTQTEMNHLTEGASQAGMGVILTLAAMIGIWGTACMINGIAKGSLLEMARGYLTAIIGM
ncbi:hypothetical protein ACFL6N_06175, partial [Thermodesulfobacteriota bacterium]